MAKRRLTKHQKRRIQDNLSKHQGSDCDNSLEGLVVAHHGKKLLIEDSSGQRTTCHTRQNIGDVVCGDNVVWHQDDTHDEGVIVAVKPRQSLLVRPGFADRIKSVAANISLICIVISPEPEPQENLIDRYLVAAEHLNIRPIIVSNKIDLLDNDDAIQKWDERFSEYQKIGYSLLHTSTKQSNGLGSLMEVLQENKSILVGQSGVGKSSLINALIPDKAIKVSELSEQISKGQHTTSHSELYHLPSGNGSIIDSPGVRDFRLGHLENEAIETGFIEFRPHIGHCRFSNCQHQQEPGCALQQAVLENRISVRRLESYFEILSS